MARSVPATVDRSVIAASSRGRFTAWCESLLSGLVALTFFARFYLPTEDAANGTTLWIVALWLVIGLLTLLLAWRRDGEARRFDGCDASVLLLIGGQVVSAVVVVATTGDKRAAVNVAWEWIGVGVVWCVLRSRWGDASFRETLLRASVVTGCVLAGLGVWQHYVSQPELVREYGPLFDRLRTATGVEVEALQRTLAKAGVPTDGPALTLFEKRMRDSREPMGLFGLANTFGGCLAVWLVLALASFRRVEPVQGQLRDSVPSAERRDDCRPVAPPTGRRWGHTAQKPELDLDRFLGNAPRDPQWLLDVVFAVASVALIAWCLLLTKSRTAVLGTACGSAVLVVGRRLPSLRFGHAITPWFRRTVVFIGGGGVLFAIAIGVLLQSGGLDREVLSEAPKSVSYRLQYWRATAQLVAAHPWLGVGPGNFRPHYLKYKLPEASEEIADPHNLFFDVAATGGLVSLMGLVLLLVMPVCGRAPCDHELASVSATSSDSRWPFWCAGAAPLLAFTGLMTLNGEWDDRLLVLSCGWFCVSGVRSWLAAGVTSESRDVAHWAFAAAVALVVHLLGAGGISMPAVSQLLLGLIAFSLSPRSIPGAANVETLSSGAASALRLFENGLTPQNRGADAAPPGSLIKPRVRLTRWLRAGALMGWAVTVTVFFATALVPVTRCQSWLAIGNRLALARDGRSGAEAAYRAACLADEWSSRPWHRRAELTYEQAARDRFRSNELFEAAVKLLLDSMTRDPHNFQGPRTLGNWWLARWQVTQNDHDARQAFEWLGRASDSYPTNASLLAELSQAATAASQPADAASAAQGALKQNELNRRLGHVDRYLAEEVVARLQRLVETARSP